MRALIIGVRGNVGRWLKRHCISQGDLVMGVDIKHGIGDDYQTADINDAAGLVGIFQRFKPQVVYSLAAVVSRVVTEQARSLAVRTNLSGAFDVARLCNEYGSLLVHFSTSEVYGNTEAQTEDSTPRPNNFYGLTKYLCEDLIKYECNAAGLRAVILRPFMLYCEDEDRGDHRSCMVRFATDLAHDKPITVHVGAKRGWLHMSDAARIIRNSSWCASEKCPIFNVGHPDIHSIQDLAEMIAIELKKPFALIKSQEIPDRMTLIKYPDLSQQWARLNPGKLMCVRDGIKLICGSVLKDILCASC